MSTSTYKEEQELLYSRMKAEAAKIMARRDSLVSEFNTVKEKLVNNPDNEPEEDYAKYDKRQDELWAEINNEMDAAAIDEQLAGLKLGLYLHDAKQMFESLSAEKTSRWRYDFDNFAKKKSRGKDKSTTDNYRRIARIFIADKEKLDVPRGIDFDPWLIKPSNLLITAAHAEKGTLSDKAWKLLADPETEQDKLLTAIHATTQPDTTNKPEPTQVFRVEDDLIYFFDFVDNDWHVIQKIERDSDDPSVSRGLDLMCEKLPTIGML